MKREIWLLLIVNGGIILFLLTQTFGLLTLFNDDIFSDTIIDADLEPVKYLPTRKLIDLNGTEIITMEPDRPLIIPKLIHQTYISTDIPLKWNKTYNSVRTIHPDYEYMFWTDESSRDFIDKQYHWFLETYDSYPYNIMRADVIRYFVLVHYGGIYVDLDNGCDFNMDPLRAFPAWLRKTEPIGVSNDIMGSIPRHPFFLKVLSSLKAYNRNWIVSYLTIMYSTGPLFLSVIRRQYKSEGVPPGGEVRILLPVDHSKHTTFFFYQGEGSSWHQGDANFVIFMGDHLILVMIVVTLLVAGFLYGQYKIYQSPFTVLSAVVGRLRRMARFIYRLVQKAVRTFSCSSSSASSSSSSLTRPSSLSRSRSVSPYPGTTAANNGGGFGSGGIRSYLMSMLDEDHKKPQIVVRHEGVLSNDEDEETYISEYDDDEIKSDRSLV